MCVDFGAHRIELANVQYHGWALVNRSGLLPTVEQLQQAETLVQAKRKILANGIELVWVLADYFEGYPKPCMGGWARNAMTVAPDGTALPCPGAGEISTLRFENVREHSLREIWEDSPSFGAFRGSDWMREPCRSCERKHVDFGGCRCQAWALVGDAGDVDPVCTLSRHREVIDLAISSPPLAEFRYRGCRRPSRFPTETFSDPVANTSGHLRILNLS
jgi:pyrroloquinoline quinone biosynthesis protein E